MKAKRWIVREHDAERAASLARVLGVSPILAALLITRGYDDETRGARVPLSNLRPTSRTLLHARHERGRRSFDNTQSKPVSACFSMAITM